MEIGNFGIIKGGFYLDLKEQNARVEIYHTIIESTQRFSFYLNKDGLYTVQKDSKKNSKQIDLLLSAYTNEELLDATQAVIDGLDQSDACFKDVSKIFDVLGHILAPVPQKTHKKAQHRWLKSIKDKQFHLQHETCVATIVWQKRNEMCLKAGATMLADKPLNKDGSIGIAVKMGDTLRQEHMYSFKDFTTTEDIILKSVNEVGLFLYYGGTNSWLLFKDDKDITIDAYTRID